MTVTEIALDDRWAYGPGIQHGGFLLELLAGHAVTTQHPHPLSTSAHFLSAAQLGPAQVHLTRLREGRSTTVTRVQLVQQDRACLDVVITTGRLEPPDPTVPPTYSDLAPVALPSREHCVRSALGVGQPGSATASRRTSTSSATRRPPAGSTSHPARTGPARTSPAGSPRSVAG